MIGRHAHKNHRCCAAATSTVLVLLLSLLGCEQNSRKDETPGRRQLPRVEKPNIIIWLVDTLRADHLGVYGYSRDTAPRLDEFTRDAVVFDNAYAPSSWTKPSAASLLTGLNPNRHGAVGYYGRLSGVRLIGDYLKPLGYQSAAFAANAWIRPLWGFSSGFDLFDQSIPTGARANRVADAVVDYLDHRAVQPFLCYVHVLDPHEGYTPPPPYDTMWGTRLTKRAAMARYIRNAPPALVEDMIKGYDGEITFSDHHFGRVLDELKRRGLYQDSLIVFTSDHGEEFFEHGHGGHGRSLHQTLVRIPLIVKFPRNDMAGRRASARVSLLDVLPTLAAYLAIEDTEVLDGTDLMKVLADQTRPASPRALFMQCDHVLGEFKPPERSVLTGVLLGRYKYVEQTQPQSGRWLFDVVTDPAERVNLLDSDPASAAALAELLANHLAQAEPGIHFRNVNLIEKNANVHTFQITFRTEGRFVDLRRRQFEDGDVARILEDGRVLRMAVRGINRCDTRNLRVRNWWLVDEDSISFNVEPAGARIVVERYECDAAPEVGLSVGSGKVAVKTLPFAFDIHSKEVLAIDAGALVQPGEEFSLTGPPGGYLAVVPPRSQVAQSELDDATRERLRALGYVSP